MQWQAKPLYTKLGNVMTSPSNRRLQLTLEGEAANEVGMASCQRLRVSRPDGTSNLHML